MPRCDFLLDFLILASVLAAYNLCARAQLVTPMNNMTRLDSNHRLFPQQDSLNFTLLANYLPRPTVSIEKLENLPNTCLTNTECTGNITATNVTFVDCGSPWTICRCESGEYDPISFDTAIDRLARVPVGLRRYIGTILLLGDDSPSAYTLVNGDIHLFGNLSIDGWLHEASHAFDFSFDHHLSDSESFISAVGNDTCVPDNYALNSIVEDFAQMSVMKLYSLAHYGTLPPEWKIDCMQRQLQFMDGLPVFNQSTLFGTCDMTNDLALHQKAPPSSEDVDLVIPLSQDSNIGHSMSASTSFISVPTSTTTAAALVSGDTRSYIPSVLFVLPLIVVLALL